MCRTTWKHMLHGLCAMATVVAAIPHEKILGNAPPGVAFKVPRTSRPPVPAKFSRPSQNTQRIQGFGGAKTNSRSVAAVLGAHQRQVGGFGYENITSTNAYGTQYATQVVWDGVPVSLLLDTGSSDTWVVQSNFSCIDYSGQVVAQGACAFGPVYPGGFSSGPVVPRQHMYIDYGDGEIVSGPMGYSDIALGNLTVKRQQACLATTAYWFGNNKTSGLLGLAFPSLTNSYLGASSDSHDPAGQVEYSPLFTSMVGQGRVAPLFSIAVDRNDSTGVISWGGIPATTGLDPSRTATLDMIITNLVDQPATAYQYSFYTVIPDGWQFGQATNTAKYPYIVDSGTTLCYLPPDIAQAISQAFTPTAVYLWTYGAYFTSCDAIAPIIAVILDGIKFFISAVDLIYRHMVDPLTGLCMVGISNGGSGPYILGDVFMQNALVIFDVGEAKMRFIPRQFYS